MQADLPEVFGRFWSGNFGTFHARLFHFSEDFDETFPFKSSATQLRQLEASQTQGPSQFVHLRGGDWVNANFQVLSNSCQSVLGAPELKSL